MDRWLSGGVLRRTAAGWLCLLCFSCSDSKPQASNEAQGGVSGGGSATAGSSSSTGGSSAGASTGGQAGTAGETAGESTSSVRPVRLRVELRAAPLAVQTVTPRLRWELESSDPKARGLGQTSYEVLVGSSRASVAAGEGDLFASGEVNSKSLALSYAGKALHSAQRVYWKVRVRDQAAQLSAWSDVEEFTVGLLAAPDWEAEWIGGSTTTMPIFRHEFTVSKPVERALLSVCGLGHFEARINGVNASDAVMEPSWTNYGKTCQYVTYDVTKSLVSGPNVVGVLLGNGMYNVPANDRYTKFNASLGAPKLILRLNLEHEDGTTAAVVSDTSWKTTAGPITFSNIYGGEDFDAAKEPKGWDRPGFDDSKWSAASVVGGRAPELVARAAPPVKVQEEFTAQKITEPQPGVFVYDLGQNFSGWPAIEVSGAAGKTIKLTPGELLSGGLVTQTAVGSPVYFSYTLKGDGTETWHPRFSYTGFRYVQVEGAVPAARAADFPDRPKLSALKGQFVYTAAEPVGKFKSSDNELNRIHQLILQAFRSNLQTILTDCPTREKLGWLEQSHLLAPSLMYDFDLATFYEKIADDMAAAQLASGLVPNIAPEFTSIGNGDFRNSPEWGSAFIIGPWWAYQMYGERAVLDDHYAEMKRYEAYLASQAKGNLLSYGLGDWYDVAPGANPGRSKLTSAGVTATVTWLQDLQVLEKTAELLGNTAEAQGFKSSQEVIAKAFNTQFLKSGSYDRGSQTANAMPLVAGIVPAEQRSAVESSLVASVTSAENRVTAGDVGFVYLLRALSRAGRGDVIFSMLKQTTGPGYLYQLAKGATSLTEAWDANPRSSQNHAMLGHAEEWLYNGLGGINPDPEGPGFEKFVISPQPQKSLTSVETEYRSIRGLIKSSWSTSANEFRLNITVPVSSTATVYIPTSSPATVTEGGAPAATAQGVLSHTEQNGALMLVVGSGDYSFAASR